MVVALRELAPITTGGHARFPLLLALLAAAGLLTAVFGLRAYSSYQALRSAREVTAAEVAPVRPWMTLHYVAHAYGVPEDALVERLGLPPGTDSQESLRALAHERGYHPSDYARLVQQAVVELRRAAPPTPLGGGP
jgi:hypothetical protein